MTRESWPFSGPRESLPRRAGYRSMRLKVETDFGGRWASGIHTQGAVAFRTDGRSR